MGTAATPTFEPLESRSMLSTVLWTGAGNGTSWEDPNNWSTQTLPGATADVVIDVATNPVITLSSATATVHSLQLAESLTITGGLLAVATTASLTAGGAVTLNGGTISGGSWDATAGAFRAGASTASTVSAVTFSGELVLPGGANLRIASGITLAPTARIRLMGAMSNSLGFAGSTMLAAGMISLENTAGLAFVGCVGTGTLTIGPGASIAGGRGVIGQNVFSAGNAGLVNQGTISATGDGTVTINASGTGVFANSGTLEAIGAATLSVVAATWSSAAGATVRATGGTVSLSGAWTNAGAIVCDGGTVNLGGTISPSSLAGLTRTAAGGTVNLTGMLNNAGSTLTLDDTTGSWTLNGGTIMGGTVAVTQSAMLVLTSNNASTLSGVTFSGELVLAAGNALRVASGLTLTAGSRIRLTGDGAAIGFAGAQSVLLSGMGEAEIVFEVPPATPPMTANATLGFVSAGAVTIGAGIRIHGANGTVGGAVFGGAPGTLVNQGTISADTAGSPITIRGTFTNSGTVEAIGGATLTIPSGASVTNLASATLTGGTWRVLDGCTLEFGPGPIRTNAATIYLQGASALAALSGLATNNGSLTLADGRAFDFAPASGTFTNGAMGTLTKAGTGTVVIPSSLALDSPGVVVVSGGTLSIPGSIVQHTGGSLTGGTWKALDGATLLLPGLVTTNGGTIVLAGTGSIPAAAMLGTNTGVLTLSDGAPFLFAPTGGVFVNAAGATLVKAGTGDTEIPASILFNNQGAVRVRGGTLTIGNCTQAAAGSLSGGSWDLAGGMLDLPGTGGAITSSAASVSFTAAGGVFPAFLSLVSNTGTITVATGGLLTLPSLTNTGTLAANTGGVLSITGGLDQNGVAMIAGGELHIGAGGTSIGSFALSASGTVFFEGDQTLTPSVAFTGASGTVSFVGGTVTSAASFGMAAQLSVAGGMLVQSVPLTLTGVLAISTGRLYLNANSTVPTLQLSGGTLDGSGDLTITGALQFTGGTMAGGGRTVVNASGSLTINGPAGKVVSRFLETAAATTWSAGTLYLDGGGITNRAAATFTISSDLRLLNRHPAGVFTNLGTIVKSGSSNADILAVVNNSGTVRVSAGSLSLLGGGSHTGAFIANGGATLRMAGENSATAASTLTGGGSFALLGGSLSSLGGFAITGQMRVAGQASFAGAVTAGTVAIAGGSLALGANSTAASLVNAGTLDLHKSTLTLTGAYTQTSAGTLMTTIDTAMMGFAVGHITAAGAAQIGGALQVSFGSVYPDDGAVFTFVTGASRTGTFQTATAASLGPNRAFVFSYTPTTARMTVRARIFDG